MKKDKFFKRLACGTLVLTAASFCVVGTTFARYASAVSGTAGVNVAKWDITGITDASTAFTISATKLSPSQEAYVSSDRSNEIETGEYVVSNNSDVDATITIATTGVKMYNGSDEVTDDDIKNPFTIEYSISTDSGAHWAPYTTGVTLAAKNGATVKSLNIKAKIVWTSESNSLSGDAADANDTKIGTGVTKVEGTVKISAVQGSVLPVPAP